MKKLRFQLSALTWMVLGTAGVFTSLLFMNQFVDEPEKKQRISSIEFEVKQPDKPKPKIEQKPKPKKVDNTPPPPVPAAMLDGSLSGIDLGLDAFAMGSVGDVDASLLGDMKNVVMTGDMVDVKPRAKYRMPVEYPSRAKAKEIEGYVVLSLLIDEQGRVQKVKVLEAEPQNVFEKSAEQTVKSWLFEPARYKGEPVKTWATQTITFELG